MGRRMGIAAAVLIAAVALVAIAATSFGRDGGAGQVDRKLHPALARPAAPQHAVVTAAATRRPKVRYLESDATTLGPGASDGFSFTCPRRTPRAVSGYGGSAQAAQAGDIVVADSTPFRKGRSWSVGVKNLTDQPREFYVGVVCVG